MRRNQQCAVGWLNRPPGIQQAGASMVELLLVVAILMLMVVLYWGKRSSRPGQPEIRACAANLQKIQLALQIYAQDHQGLYPRTLNAASSEDPLTLLVPKYSADNSIFLCPATKDALPPDLPLNRGRISYAYYMGWKAQNTIRPILSDRQIDSAGRRIGDRTFSEDGKPPANNHGSSGGHILFTDGRVEFSPPQATFAISFPTNVTLLNPKP